MNRRSMTCGLGVLLCALACLLPTPARAQVPRTMTVQGILRDASGVPVEAATVFRFELLDGTTTVWMEQQSVSPRAGLFTARLGASTPLDPSDFTASLALRITVDGESMDPIPLTSVPYAFRAETVETYDGDVSWGQVTGVPAGFADGTDDGTTYAAGAGLALTGDTFAVDASAVQTRVAGACAPGSSIRAIAQDGTVVCEADDSSAAGATYTAGNGLTLMGSTFAVDSGVVQARIASTCPIGASIRAIGGDGTVTCESDDDTTYAAGTGLTLTGSTFTADTSYLQRRVAATCAVGSSIRSIAADGTVTCETDDAGGAGGRNMIRWGSDPAAFTLVPATVNRTVVANTTPGEVREGDASFTLSSTTIAEPGVIALFGTDLIPVDPNVVYEGRISAKALAGSTIGSDFTGYFSAGFVPYNSAGVQLAGNAGVNAPTVSGLSCSTFLANGVAWTSFSASTFSHFSGRVTGEGTGINQFPVGTRFIRPCIGTNIVGIGRTVIDSFEFYGRSRMQPAQNTWANGTTGARAWVTIPGSAFTVTTSGGALLINMNLFVNGGSHVTCQPIIDGAWAGSFAGLPSAGDPFWREGLVYSGGFAGNWIPWASSRLYPGVPSGTHTIAAQCATDGGTAGYCNAGSVNCSLSVIELD